ncbi:hypothetical protein GCM10027586_07900 [Kineococcus gypseus]|uniref:hypothetical protein n=1 Tax=Kineococcus gypseus TaxID=1637102 RepID=UPI003D7C46EA
MSTAAFAAWRWGFSPVVGEGTFLPWTLLGLIAATATIATDRLTRPFTGVATTAAAAVLADLLTGERGALGASSAFDVTYVAFPAAALAAAFSALHLLLARLPRSERPWAGAVALLGAAAWVAWLGWWPLDDSGPAHPGALLAAAVGTLITATALGEVTLGRWRGAVFALAPAALLAVPPLSTSDALWFIAWLVLTFGAALVCLVTVGAVAAVRGTRRHLHAAPR